MDEVDGMAGNEDRGGVQELIQLIKHTKIPIICMCNDRNHPKIRSLSNYCFDLRFQRPRVEQIKGPLLSIIYKEGLKIPPAALNDIISAANHDIRQVIHNLSMWTARDKSLTYDQLKAEAAKAQKDLRLGPFDVCRKVFVGGEETANMSLMDKMDLFFHDYSIGPLFVQENYIHVMPFAARGVQQHLRCLSRAADSIARGDLVDAFIRRGQNWTLLPTQAVYASVLPGEAMRGSVGQMIQFPSWLGKNSTTSKNDRIIQELCHHMRLHISANRRSLAMEYLPFMRQLVTYPLVVDGSAGVDSTVSMLHAYDLQREDFDSVLEVTSWSTTKDPMSSVDSKVKAAFTRAYNKAVHLAPYSSAVAPKKRGRGAVASDDLDGLYDDLEEGGGGGADAEENEQSDEDVSVDAMIKQKKAPAPRKSGKNNEGEGAKKGQGKGKGQAQPVKASGQSRKKK
jgi:replication factor C subunit 1